MSRPTMDQIKNLMRKQNYENYIVNDAQSFIHLLPFKVRPTSLPQKNQGETNDAYRERKRTWAQTHLTEEGWKVYDNANNSKPTGFSPPPGSNTANTFVNARSSTQRENSSECSNFARHAIGTLIQSKDITDHYNIVYAGIMEGRHNIAILVPKEQELNLHKPPGNKAPTLVGALPAGSMIIDPWALGMRKPFDQSFCSPDKFAFRKSLNEITVHYQSKNDNVVEEVQAKAKHDDPSIQLSHGSSSTAQPVNPTFKSTLPVPEQYKEQLAHFDDALKAFKAQVQDLTARGYPSAAAEGQKVYNTLVDARNDLISKNFSPESKKEFETKSNHCIEEAKKGELKDARGFSKIFFNLVKAIAYVCSFGLYSKQTKSINQMNDIKAALKDVKSKDENNAEHNSGYRP